jgi:hypothetical protein
LALVATTVVTLRWFLVGFLASRTLDLPPNAHEGLPVVPYDGLAVIRNNWLATEAEEEGA